MKSLVYFYATLVSVASVTYAKNCNTGLIYCGSTLMDMGNLQVFPSSKTLPWIPSIEFLDSNTDGKFIGDYKEQVEQALVDHGITNPSNFQLQNTLFYCVGPPDGQIAFFETCAIACKNEGVGNDDECFEGKQDIGFRVSSSFNRLKVQPHGKDDDRRLVINW